MRGFHVANVYLIYFEAEPPWCEYSRQVEI